MGSSDGAANSDEELESESLANTAQDQEDGGSGDSNRYLPLYNASLSGDWETAKWFLDKDKDAATAPISSFSETPLHVAVLSGKANEFVRKLVDMLPPEALAIGDCSGDTALHNAAQVGNTEAAKILVTKNPDLLYILSDSGRLPVLQAAIYCQKETVKYLLSMSKPNVEHSPFHGLFGVDLLNNAIGSEFFDVALDLVEKYPDLARMKSEKTDLTALSSMADMGTVFLSGERFSWWERWIYHRITLKQHKFEDETSDAPVSNKGLCVLFGVCQKFELMLCKVVQLLVPCVEEIKEKKAVHEQALAVVKRVCQEMLALPQKEATSMFKSSITKAAKYGISEIVEVIMDVYPMATNARDGDTDSTIFLLAAKFRFENVFNLFYRMSDRKYQFVDNTDNESNNLMHICGKLAPPDRLNLVRGAALQMQRELQWFKGQRIHASIRSDLLPRLKMNLTEGALCAVKNFVVANNRMRFKTTTNRYMLMFINDTRVTEFIDASFPSNIFLFRPFTAVTKADDIDETVLIDVIGRVLSLNRPCVRTNNESETKRMEVVLEDHDGNRLSCTLWEDFVDQMMERFEIGGDAPIMILQFCRRKLFRDSVSVSTTYNATRMILDGDLEEVAIFKAGFDDADCKEGAVKCKSLGSFQFGNCNSLDEDFTVRTIEQIRVCGQVGTFWINARILCIESVDDWWYMACRKCFKGLGKVDERFYCTNCDEFGSAGNVRFKLRVLVQDCTDNASLILWDKQCVELIGRTALELREQYVMDTDNLLPCEISNLLDKELFFKVQVAPDQVSCFHGAYSVRNIRTEVDSTVARLDLNQGSDLLCNSGVKVESDLPESPSLFLRTPSDQGIVDKGEGEVTVLKKSVKRKLVDGFFNSDSEEEDVVVKKEKIEDP